MVNFESSVTDVNSRDVIEMMVRLSALVLSHSLLPTSLLCATAITKPETEKFGVHYLPLWRHLCPTCIYSVHMPGANERFWDSVHLLIQCIVCADDHAGGSDIFLQSAHARCKILGVFVHLLTSMLCCADDYAVL